MMAPQGLVLDFDGPLLNGIDRHYAVYRDILEENNFRPLPRDRYWDLKRNLINRRDLLSMSGAAHIYDLFLHTWLHRIELKEYLQLDQLQPGVVEVLADWRSQAIPVFLATMRNNRPHLDWQLQELGLSAFFDAVVVIEGHPQTGDEPWKSKAAGVRDLLGVVPPESVLWVGDTEVDIRAAQALGAQSCAVLCGLRTEAHLRKFTPDYVVSDVPELAAMLRSGARKDGGVGES